MTEAEARAWLVREFDVPRETLALIERFIDLLCEANRRHNLVAAATLGEVWNRHIADSAQLLRYAPCSGLWVDLGSGAGFPGLIVALLHPGPVILIEQRRLRAGFLEQTAADLGLERKVRILCANVRQADVGQCAVISARAFAPLDRLFASALHLAADGTRWVLPKGRNAKTELEAARASWQGVFRLEPSVTDADASIIVAERVRPRSRGKQIS